MYKRKNYADKIFTDTPIDWNIYRSHIWLHLLIEEEKQLSYQNRKDVDKTEDVCGDS